jgi:hypothetical protein
MFKRTNVDWARRYQWRRRTGEVRCRAVALHHALHRWWHWRHGKPLAETLCGEQSQNEGRQHARNDQGSAFRTSIPTPIQEPKLPLSDNPVFRAPDPFPLEGGLEPLEGPAIFEHGFEDAAFVSVGGGNHCICSRSRSP